MNFFHPNAYSVVGNSPHRNDQNIPNSPPMSEPFPAHGPPCTAHSSAFAAKTPTTQHSTPEPFYFQNSLTPANSILLSFEKRSILHSLPTTLDEMKKAAFSKFSIDLSLPIIIQYFNKSWGEFIDVFQDDEIIPGCKYRIIVQPPPTFYVENSPSTHKEINASDLLSQHLRVENSFNSDESWKNDESNECSDHAEQNSDAEYLQGVRFSSSLNEALKKQAPLRRGLRSELVTAYCNLLTTHTKYPSSTMVTDAARKIVRDYPYLKETVGNGYKSWRQAIRDRLKRLRKYDTSEEVKRVRKKRRRSSKAPVDEQGELPNSVEVSLVQELNDLVSDSNESSETRKKDSVQGQMKIWTLKAGSPALFSKLDLEKEFHSKTGKLNLFQYVPKFLETYGEKLYTLLRAEKNIPAWAHTVKCMLDAQTVNCLLEGSDKNVQVIKDMYILVTLPVHFSEDQLALTYPPTVNEKFVEEGSATPHIAIVGLETNAPRFCVLTEHQVVLELSNISDAVAALFAMYCIFHCPYPKELEKTLLFLESFVFSLHLNDSNLPSRVVNFVEKLKNFQV